MSLLRPVGAVLIALTLPLSTSGCSRPAVMVAALPPAEVTVAKPIVRETIDYDEYIGQVQALASVTVSARVSGYIQKVNFIDGQTVKEGEVLFEIDPRTYQAELDVAKAQIEAAQAALKFSESQVARNTSLQKRGAVTQEDVDLSVSQRDSNAAQVALAQATAEDKRLYVDWCKVTAPIAGRVGRRLVDPGNQIGGTAGLATALTTIVSQDPIYVYFDVDERAVQRYRQAARDGTNPVRDVSKIADVRMPLYVALASDSGFTHEGYIDFVDNQVNQTSGTVRCRGVFQNPDGVLVPGYFARVRVRSGQPYQGTLVAERAVLAQQSDRYVLVVENVADGKGVVAQRSVVLGRLHGGLRVIAAGLKPDDLVIVEGVQRARPGETVAIAHSIAMPEPAGAMSEPSLGNRAPMASPAAPAPASAAPSPAAPGPTPAAPSPGAPAPAPAAAPANPSS